MGACATLVAVRPLRFATDPLVNRDQDLRRWQRTFDAVVPIADARPRHENTVVGVVQRIRVDPGHSVAVTVEDGSGDLEAAWFGRSSLRGVVLGSALRLTGTVAEDPDGRLRMLNPAWVPIAEPYT